MSSIYEYKYLKYKNKYLQLSGANKYKYNQPLFGGGKNDYERVVPHIQNEDCIGRITGKKGSRKDLIEKCLPMYAMFTSHINIIDVDYIDYIQYNPQNRSTYRMDNNFMLNKLDDVVKLYISATDHTMNILHEHLDKKFNYLGIEFPIYYLFVNHIPIFNYIRTKSKILDNIFIYDKTTLRFINMSTHFNIFNIAFLTNKIFHIISLFMKNNLDSIDKNYISTEIAKIFNDYSIENMYDINTYIRYINYSGQHKDKILDSELAKLPQEVQNATTQHIIDFENKLVVNRSLEEKKLSKQYVLNELTDSFINICKQLNSFTTYIPNYKILFLTSILSYRLKNKYLSNCWGFCTNKVYDIIIKHVAKDDQLNVNSFKELYLPLKPDIYEALQVTYREKTYGNCMENTIFQFLKILFWNNSDNKYDNDLIDLIVKKTVADKIKNFFIHIETERTPKFVYDWVKYVTEIPSEYDFISENVELNACLKNLIIFMKYIVKDEFYDADDSSFLNKIVLRFDEDYSISIKTSTEEDTVNIYMYRNIKMLLFHNRHAYFDGALDDNKTINILDKLNEYPKQISSIKDLVDYTKLDIPRSLSNIPSYIHINSLSDNKAYERIIKSSLWMDIFNDGIRDKFEDNFWSEVVEKEYILGGNRWMERAIYFSNTIWHEAVKNIKSKNFWLKVAEKEDIWGGDKWMVQNLYSETIWHETIQNIESEDFWSKVAEKEDVWGGDKWMVQNMHRITIWHGAVKNIKSEKFWSIVAEKEDVWGGDKWMVKDYTGDTIWHKAVKNIKSEKFWSKVAEKEDGWLGDIWTVGDTLGTSIWEYASKNIKSKKFWSDLGPKNRYSKNILNSGF